ncbi:hypothetical protein E2C01_099817 [Portunus trituberculatus]|uniref:Uncharacterized protein n=1 Tax=Portunus trituberculatus TaxID=210409 RepID=A0A5B7KBP6_PORTR|nr:hypothetical protein [Portunus trituberculatus]
MVQQVKRMVKGLKGYGATRGLLVGAGGGMHRCFATPSFATRQTGLQASHSPGQVRALKLCTAICVEFIHRSYALLSPLLLSTRK